MKQQRRVQHTCELAEPSCTRCEPFRLMSYVKHDAYQERLRAAQAADAAAIAAQRCFKARPLSPKVGICIRFDSRPCRISATPIPFRFTGNGQGCCNGTWRMSDTTSVHTYEHALHLYHGSQTAWRQNKLFQRPLVLQARRPASAEPRPPPQPPTKMRPFALCSEVRSQRYWEELVPLRKTKELLEAEMKRQQEAEEAVRSFQHAVGCRSSRPACLSMCLCGLGSASETS
jgi:hypothetical protein